MVHCARWGGKMCCARAWFHVKCFGFDVKWFTSPPGGSVPHLSWVWNQPVPWGFQPSPARWPHVSSRCVFFLHSWDGRWIFGTGQKRVPPPNASFATEIDQPHLWAPWRPSDLTRPIFPICSSYAWCNPHEIPSESPCSCLYLHRISMIRILKSCITHRRGVLWWLLIFRADFFGWAERFNGLWLLAYLTVRLWYALNMCSLPSKRWKSMKYVPLYKNYATDMILTFSGLVAGSHLSCLSFAFQVFINNRNFTLLPRLIPQ